MEEVNKVQDKQRQENKTEFINLLQDGIARSERHTFPSRQTSGEQKSGNT